MGMCGSAAVAGLVLVAFGDDMQRQDAVAYEAEYEEVFVTKQPSGTPRETKRLWKLYRDGRGRWRQEVTAISETGEQLRLGLLMDPASGRVRLIDLDSRQTLDRTKLPRNAAEVEAVVSSLVKANPSASPPTAARDREAPEVQDLGHREIEGLPARGHRLSTAHEVTEVWTTPLIDQPHLFSHTIRSDGEETHRLFNIRMHEPDRALFAPLDDGL